MADEDISTIVRFDNRKLTTLTESSIRIMFDEHPFDMNLIAANDKKIPVHSFVLMMFSPYIRHMTLKDELPTHSITDVLLTDFSYEVLCNVRKYIYYGEAIVRNEIKAQFAQALKKLNILRPLCSLEDSESDEESDEEGYKELMRDNDANLFECDQKIRQRHKRPEGKVPYACDTPDCRMAFFTKVVDGKTMIKVVHSAHSKICEKQRKQRTTSQNDWSDLLRLMMANKANTTNESSVDKDSKAPSSDLSKKPSKKGAKQSNGTVAVGKEKK